MAKTIVIVTCLVAFIVAVLVADVVAQTPTPSPCTTTPPPDLQQNCAGAYLGFNPSAQCCSVLKREERCLCTYASNPDYAIFVNSDTSKRIAAKCNITLTC
ncbi:probable non-specific lipid-transfer protein AKCS9 [Amaranthus tricolor]|uniref:probable non-specific lipid-transfer protein AKCS9 n=1 Tax=Amaranthus tricolor TaxID=29722 RepID=UPI0025862A86|nr:probable non-specific lipid-transfer protein AKCS9 [Amaranthus tricolor]